jgi:DNA-binding CsgD family transcriptional regulator
MTTLFFLLFWLIAPALIAGAVIAWALETQPERIRRWHQQGISQSAIAARLGISRHRVRAALAA